MKTIKFLLWCLGLLMMTCAARAQYPVIFSASLSTETNTGTAASLQTIHVSNKTIASEIFNSGTSGAAKASDLVLVENPYTFDVYVINKTNDDYVMSIATVGGSSTDTEVASTSRTGKAYRQARTDYEFTLPGVPTVQVTNILEESLFDPNTDIYSRFFVSFVGGSGGQSTGATFFQGTIKQTAHYVD